MNLFDISKISEYREGNQIEAKKAFGGLPNSLWETYFAFANTDGGYILLGVDEDKQGNLQPIGVKDADKLVKDFWNIINNRQKISLNILTDRDGLCQDLQTHSSTIGW